ncbi:protein of unknown function [Taphrina deformans PYCC 5710]|uniref:DNA-directed RNA polymerase RBP11-like dimerisation domain-containing protein n=1 Tax=Taphrina deformans (strain PYCC 5710 / ATCC 11124 / CBS 356.35 / IMI 108563 / JCM 9778 / NBRC 8474) TaxID=1097556 RepID=R4XFR4_TAPDE|nr:protein of unknown function [Taphrina deformans PYCC 5710]|eukprot:CCG84701.1 protein of unknown function [Taphrina deformans PYCC 5710]
MEGRQYLNLSKQQKLKTVGASLPGAATDGTASSFQLANEDHTLGNALRYMIMKNPLVEFCGYSIPHPSEPLLNIRIQTYPVDHPSFTPIPGRQKDEPYTALEALEKGLDDLMQLCDVMSETFQGELDAIGGGSDEEMQE